jgi:hypothetical protein
MHKKLPGSVPLRAATAAAIAAALASPAARASDQIFTHTYLSETTPAGEKEIEQQTTYRDKKSQGTYRLWQSRTEFEYGITDRWQVSLYANAYSVTAENNNSIASRNNFTAGPGDGDEVTGGGPATIGSYVPGSSTLPIPAARYSKSDFESVSVETVYQFLSPYKDGFGLAGYLEATGGSKTAELELKLIAQKNLLEDDLILAANIALEFENNRWSNLGSEKETELVISGGASYRFAPGWRVGLEIRNERAWEGGYTLSSGKRDYSAWFAGPTIHYAGKIRDQGFFVTAGYSTQLPWASAYSPSSQVELVDGRVYKETEKNVFRVIVGVSF